MALEGGSIRVSGITHRQSTVRTGGRGRGRGWPEAASNKKPQSFFAKNIVGLDLTLLCCSLDQINYDGNIINTV